MDQLRELVARIASRPLDRTRPLWEVYFVEGLAEGRIALLTKSHQILVDGRETVDIGQVLLDTSPDRSTLGHDDDWRPRRTAGPVAAALNAVTDTLERPSTLWSTTAPTPSPSPTSGSGIPRTPCWARRSRSCSASGTTTG